MRTTPEENRQMTQWMAAKINRSKAPFILLLPENGVSLLDAPGKPFFDPEANRALFEELGSSVQQTPTRQIRRVPANINDPAFTEALLVAFAEVSIPVGYSTLSISS